MRFQKEEANPLATLSGKSAAIYTALGDGLGAKLDARLVGAGKGERKAMEKLLHFSHRGQTGTAAIYLGAIAAGSGGFVINGQGAADLSGRSVASAGDVNGDGLADLIVGAHLSDPTAGPVAGRPARSLRSK